MSDDASNVVQKRLEQYSRILEKVQVSMEQVEKIVHMIRGLSTKTDLLALNASIEAARAGQAGKGFAIVADEVARLSEKAQESTLEFETTFNNLKDHISTLSSSITGNIHEISMDETEKVA